MSNGQRPPHVRMILLIAAASLTYATAAASDEEDEPQYYKRGVYIGGAAAFGAQNFDVPTSNAWGLDIWAGVRPARYFGFDVNYEFMNGFDRGAGRGDTHIVGLNLRGYLPLGTVGLSDRIQPYAIVGGGLKLLDVGVAGRVSGYTWRLGGGLDFYLSESFALTLNATYLLPQTDILKGTGYTSIVWGLQYRLD